MQWTGVVDRRLRTTGWFLAIAAALLVQAGVLPAQVPTESGESADPRVDLDAGWTTAGEASQGMELIANEPRPEGFVNPEYPGDFAVANSDLAFRDHHVVVGNFNGFQIYDISDPASPALVVAVVCPGGQGDVSVYGDLLFMSVEETRGRIDCGPGGVPEAVSPDRFRGVRIFDISELAQPAQVAAIQTCRGSHTHTIVEDPDDAEHIYVYVSGAAPVRPAEEMEGCSRLPAEQDEGTSLFRIEIIRVPLEAPGQAAIVSKPRIFTDAETGDIAGLWPGGDHGVGTQRTSATNHCHDITAYPAIGLAAGACSGNGILLDISDPVNPVRIDEVSDPNFAYWHSATFNNDGTKVIFTDEWGGGMAARCRALNPPEWGANAIFDIVDGRLEHAGYYKLPAAQTATENCVAHNGSLIPVPGRDIKVQAWYQGGISVFDFTDSANPFEIAFFDRGPLSEDVLMLGGHWSAYWYNGHIYGSEIARGLDVLRLTPGEHLSLHEIEAANLVRLDRFNPQHQPRNEWPASVVVARAYLDQLIRSGGIVPEQAARVANELDQVERSDGGSARRSAVAALTRSASLLDHEARLADRADRALDARRLRLLAVTILGL